MGAGASTATGKGKAKPPDSAAALAKAAESEEAAKKLFDQLDGKKDGVLSKEELSEAVKKLSKSAKADWTDELIGETIACFDSDSDGMLNLAEFAAALAELKARGGKAFVAEELQAKATERAAAAAATKAAVAVWDKHAKEDRTVWD